MTQTDLRRIVLDVLESRLRASSPNPNAMSDLTTLVELGVVDSMGFLELISELEQRTGAQFDFSEADPDDFTSVGGLMKVLLP